MIIILALDFYLKTWHPPPKLHCSVQELPLLFLKGGGIVPTGPVIQHMGEAKHTDTITLLVALDEKGNRTLFFCKYLSETFPILNLLITIARVIKSNEN